MNASKIRWIAAGLTVGLAACGGGGGGGGSGGGGATAATAKVLAANDLGMHCMDREFSVFSILPPFNVVHAQVVRPDANGDPFLCDGTQVEVRYSAVHDPSGSINSTSVAKTDFWQHASQLFGAQLQPGEGLKGLYMPADAPIPGAQLMSWDSGKRWFAAEGIPITPTDDAGMPSPYSLLRISAFDRVSGSESAHTDIVVPVAQETDCQNCHATGEIAATGLGISWSNNADREVQTKLNVLLLHDHNSATQLTAAQPVLCASCHYSPPLDLAGNGPSGSQIGHSTFSKAMHEFHGTRVDGQGQPIFPPNGTAMQTCYQCHPGAITQCARGAMSTAGMQCANCHGDMRSVGAEHMLLAGGSVDGMNDMQPRRPWRDLPRCQSCHTGDALDHLSGPSYMMASDGMRLMQAFVVNDASASSIARPTSRFAENAGMLYRFSTGHGGLSCEACHGSTHAEWPVSNPLANDNITATQLQGHAGVITECTTCHGTGTLPLTAQGPHGMHNVADARWLDENHGHFYQQDHAACQSCHGLDLKGTPLSRTSRDRSFSTEHGHMAMPKGTMVRCNMCHGMP